jgi:hypothetical protein
VQSAVGEEDTVTLSGVTPGNLILALGAADAGLGTFALSFSGFSATFSADGDNGPSTIIRAGYATGTTASMRYDRSLDINILVEISGANVVGMAEAHTTYDVFQTNIPVDGPSLAGFAAGDLVIGFASSIDGLYGSTSDLDAGVSSIVRGQRNEHRAAAVWKVASAGANSMPNIFADNGSGSGDSEDFIAHTIRIPAA